MVKLNSCTLKRNCEGIIIPAGDKINLPMGTKVDITHRLGGNFTIVCDYGMFRIEGKNADAIGEKVPNNDLYSQKKINNIAKNKLSKEDHIWAELKNVFDPEIPVNIVDLGLVYSMEVIKLNSKQYKVEILMTLTAPGCGMGPAIADDARNRIVKIQGISIANIKLVWDPPWNQNMISEVGKMELGLI